MNENSGTESRERERERENLSNEELIKELKEKELQIKKLIGGGFMAAKVHNELFEISPEERDQDEIKDGYQLKFVGKDYAKLQAGLKTETIITPDTAHNSKPENVNSENVFITGDNLDALKHLENAYSGKVDVIYIDPPYNTGSDGFVYADNFKFSDDDFKEKLNLTEEEISRVRALNGKSSHSAWLTFMLPRLMIAKRLLSDTGVIFISIDDTEQAQLKILLSEIFGESNTDTLIWNKEAENSSGTLKQILRFRNIHEYIHIAYKNKSNTIFKKIREPLKGRENELQTANLAVNSKNEKKDHENYFSIKNPSGKIFTRQWKWNRNEIERLINEDLIYWGSNGQKQPRLIIPTDERRRTYLLSILNYGGTTSGRKDFEKLFIKEGLFSFPKSTSLLKKILESSSNKNSLIMDFFAGSATTADAVMQLNKEDGGNRKYILVQLPEEVSKNSEAEKAGYKTIDQISRERIERVATKIGDNSGFKHFRLTTPNDENALLKLEEFDPNAIVAFPEDMTATFDGGEKAILQTWLIDDGFEFNQTPKIVEFAGYQAHYIEQRLYLISTGWSSEATRELLNAIGKNKLAVQSIVIFPYSFAFNELNELKINLRTAFEKSNKIELLERY